jgi:drug/metabolite transporter (DMT)-like permease
MNTSSIDMTPPPKVARSTTLAGIGLMLAGISLFALNDALGKWLVATYSVGELLMIRSAAALILLAPFIWRSGTAPFAAAPRPGLQLARIALSSIEVAMFFLAVAYLPLADVMTFYLAGPIYVTALSALLLREHVGWRRWSAVLIGFCGVLIALRPSPASFTMPALIALGGSFFFALLMVTTRSLRSTANIVLTSGQIVGTLAFGAIIAPFGWVTPSPRDLALLVLFGVISIVALACINRALALAPASVVAPFQYTMIVWGIVLGYLVFGDIPDLPTLAGAVIIIAAGLFIFWREQAAGQRESVIAPAP